MLAARHTVDHDQCEYLRRAVLAAVDGKNN